MLNLHSTRVLKLFDKLTSLACITHANLAFYTYVSHIDVTLFALLALNRISNYMRFLLSIFIISALYVKDITYRRQVHVGEIYHRENA